MGFLGRWIDWQNHRQGLAQLLQRLAVLALCYAMSELCTSLVSILCFFFCTSGGLHAELESATVIDSYELYIYLVAFFNDVAWLIHSFFAHLANMDQAVFTGKYLNER